MLTNFDSIQSSSDNNNKFVETVPVEDDDDEDPYEKDSKEVSPSPTTTGTHYFDPSKD